MSTTAPQDLGVQIKELERDKLQEELRQLKESASKRWIAPTVWLAVLPLLGGFGLWMIGELKQYNKAYQALAKADQLEKEQQAAETKRAQLNGEILTLLAQKTDYAVTAGQLEKTVAQHQQTANRLAKEVAAKRQEVEKWKQELAAQKEKLDQLYLQIVFANFETGYALSHITSSPSVDPKAVEQIRGDLKTLPKEATERIDNLLRDYQLAFELSKGVEKDLAKNSQDLQKTAVSAWARELQCQGPRGYLMKGRSIMVTKGPGERRYYDVELGKFVEKSK